MVSQWGIATRQQRAVQSCSTSSLLHLLARTVVPRGPEMSTPAQELDLDKSASSGWCGHHPGLRQSKAVTRS
ncbi:hypothetical protein GN956_G25110 [Arapaima gigas]